jgi:hypothetical protein
MRKRKEGCIDWPRVNLTNWVNIIKRMGKGQYINQFFSGKFYASADREVGVWAFTGLQGVGFDGRIPTFFRTDERGCLISWIVRWFLLP